jgi:hypothetical protein
MAFLICKIPVYLEKSIEANRNYLTNSLFYNKKRSRFHCVSVASFIEIGNLISLSKNASRT